ncbi:NUMOD3 domain-containing DNA-binding protein [Brevundimonas sp. M1A4_2e]
MSGISRISDAAKYSVPPWIYPDLFDESQLPLYAGFVYLITHLATGRMYVGRKYLKAKRGKKTVESDWRRYWSSSKELKAEFKANGHDGWERRIICFCLTKAATNYAEVEEQFARDVLKATLPDGSRAYFNRNIMARWFASPENFSDQHRENISKAMCGNTNGVGVVKSPETRAKLSAAHTGKKLTSETRAKISENNRSRGPKSDDHKAKISAAMKGVPKPPETKARMKAAQANHPGPSRETIEKSAASRRGKPSHNAGKPMTEEQKAKLRAGQIAYWDRKRAERMAGVGSC